MRIKKTSQTVGAVGTMATEYTESSNAYYNAPYINECNTYSTNEVDTGKVWIDNKKIYRKVINLGARTYSNGTNTINHNISNFDTITFPKFVVKMYDNWYERWETIKDVSINSSTIIIKTSQALTVQDSFIIFEYTKTTD